ncbi:MAG: hypothetical protein HUU20_15210 [Pirellulales bacterium]|nr:hypothetical protein [Pirellulales bacterium]
MARRPLRVVLWLLGCAATVGAAAVLSPRLRAGESPDEQHARIEAMDPSQKAELLRRQERFAGLDREERERLHRLHAALEQAPDREELRKVMRRYCQWISGLTSYERAELLTLPSEQRVERIKKHLAESDRTGKRSSGDSPSLERARRHWPELGPDSRRRPKFEDFKAVFEWSGQYLEHQKPKLLERLPESRRKQAEQAIETAEGPAKRRERLATVWMQSLMENPGKTPQIDEADLGNLRNRLAPETRAWLEALPPSEQSQIVLGWLRYATMFHLRSPRPDPTLPLVDEKELVRFFERELTPEQRDRLLNLPSEEMRRELRQEYVRWRLKDQSPRAPSWPGWRYGPRSANPSFPRGATSDERQPPRRDNAREQ